MALVVEIGFLPVKARTRLVESLTAAIRRVSEMEACIAAGIEEGVNLDVYHPKALIGFELASGKASEALAAAEMFCEFSGDTVEATPVTNVIVEVPFCNNEPRIKGSFEGRAEVYSEVGAPCLEERDSKCLCNTARSSSSFIRSSTVWTTCFSSALLMDQVPSKN